MSKVAVFDLDDTLLDFKNVMMDAIHAEIDTHVHWSQWKTYNLLNTYGITLKQLVEILIKHECIEKSIPFPLTKFTLDNFKKMGYHICLVSARGWCPDGKRLTEKWLKRYGLNYDELIITQVGENKMDSLAHHDTIDLVVDDNMDNCVDFSSSEKVKSTIMMSAPWNMHDCLETHNITRVFCLNDLNKLYI